MDYHIQRLDFTESAKNRLITAGGYGILLVIRGTAYVNDQWNVSTGEFLVCKPRQVLKLEYPGGRSPLSAIWVQISIELMQRCSTPQTDIVTSFAINPGKIVKIRGQSQLLMLIKNLATRMESFGQEKDRYANDLLEEGTVKMFLAMVLRSCVLCDLHRVRKGRYLALDEVFQYIQVHLTEEITLERLEQEFFVSRHHLIRQFKLHTGQTVHQYIVKARLDLCRDYIEQGYSITEVYRMGGFGGYNHFFRAFKQEYGMTPKEYYHTIYPQKDPLKMSDAP